MPVQQVFSFHLRPEFCRDCGWLEAVRRRHDDPAAANYLHERHPGLVAGRDPARLIATWWPVAGRMSYFLRGRGPGPCRFVATDGVFLHSIEAAGSHWRSFSGPIGELLTATYARWRELGGPDEFPLAPRREGYPQAILLHQVSTGEVSLSVDQSVDQTKLTSQKESSCLLTT